MPPVRGVTGTVELGVLDIFEPVRMDADREPLCDGLEGVFRVH